MAKRPRNKDFRDVLHAYEEERPAEFVLRSDPGADKQKFGKRSKFHQHNKTLRTAGERMKDAALAAERKQLPIGEVVQVYSLYADVEPHDTAVAKDARERFGTSMHLCTARRTLRKVISDELGEIVVGDRVRFRPTGGSTKLPGGDTDELQAEAVIEAVLPRDTILSRQDSFDPRKLDPIVANAKQFLIVVSLANPFPRWGLVDRMLVAAQSGGLKPIIVLNKVDLANEAEDADRELTALAHYETLGHATIRTSIETGEGLDRLRELLAGTTTVLAGHSGVGKSSLVRAVQPHLNLAVGDVSEAHAKGRHTTTSARRYLLDFPEGGAVVDTPGVKMFGLWGVEADSLEDFFPDIAADTAPPWRVESFERIKASLEGDERTYSQSD